MVEVEGLEPPAPWSQTTYATKLRYTSICIKFLLFETFLNSCENWQGWQDLNPRHLVLETNVLPLNYTPKVWWA